MQAEYRTDSQMAKSARDQGAAVPLKRRVGWRVSVVALAGGLLLTACGSDAGSSESTDAPAGGGVQLSAATVEGSESALDEIVAEIQGATGVPGIAVGVVYDGKPVIAKGYGVTEAGTDNAVNEQTVFQLASVSKPVGATAVAGVVGRGDIAWDQPVVSVLPDFQLSNPYVTQNATVADFYSHRTGLPGDTAGNDLESAGFNQEQILARLRYLPLEPFRATYSYSNFGMTVGGVAAAAAYGAPFPQMVQEVLLEPAGMTSTSFSYADFAARENAAVLHSKVDDGFEPIVERQPDAQAPAGGLSSNVVDMNRWLLLNLSEGQLDGQQIIDAEALAETKRSQINRRQEGSPTDSIAGYGLGWNLGQSFAVPSLVEWGHSGAFSAGAATNVKLLPELGLGVVVLTNAQPVGAAEAIGDAYVDTLVNGKTTKDWPQLYGEAFAGLLDPPPVETPAAPTAPREDSAYVGTYANDYFGDVVVRPAAGGSGLEMAIGPNGATVYPLTPLDGDTFTFEDMPEVPGALAVLAFRFDDGSAVANELVFEMTAVYGANSEATPWTVLPRVS